MYASSLILYILVALLVVRSVDATAATVHISSFAIGADWGKCAGEPNAPFTEPANTCVRPGNAKEYYLTNPSTGVDDFTALSLYFDCNDETITGYANADCTGASSTRSMYGACMVWEYIVTMGSVTCGRTQGPTFSPTYKRALFDYDFNAEECFAGKFKNHAPPNPYPANPNATQPGEHEGFGYMYIDRPGVVECVKRADNVDGIVVRKCDADTVGAVHTNPVENLFDEYDGDYMNISVEVWFEHTRAILSLDKLRQFYIPIFHISRRSNLTKLRPDGSSTYPCSGLLPDSVQLKFDFEYTQQPYVISGPKITLSVVGLSSELDECARVNAHSGLGVTRLAGSEVQTTALTSMVKLIASFYTVRNLTTGTPISRMRLFSQVYPHAGVESEPVIQTALYNVMHEDMLGFLFHPDSSVYIGCPDRPEVDSDPLSSDWIHSHPLLFRLALYNHEITTVEEARVKFSRARATQAPTSTSPDHEEIAPGEPSLDFVFSERDCRAGVIPNSAQWHRASPLGEPYRAPLAPTNAPTLLPTRMPTRGPENNGKIASPPSIPDSIFKLDATHKRQIAAIALLNAHIDTTVNLTMPAHATRCFSVPVTAHPDHGDGTVEGADGTYHVGALLVGPETPASGPLYKELGFFHGRYNKQLQFTLEIWFSFPAIPVVGVWDVLTISGWQWMPDTGLCDPSSENNSLMRLGLQHNGLRLRFGCVWNFASRSQVHVAVLTDEVRDILSYAQQNPGSMVKVAITVNQPTKSYAMFIQGRRVVNEELRYEFHEIDPIVANLQSATLALSHIHNTTRLHLGCRSTGDGGCESLMYHRIRIYPRALNETQARSRFSFEEESSIGKSAPRAPSLTTPSPTPPALPEGIRYEFPTLECTQGSIPEDSGSGIDAIVTGADVHTCVNKPFLNHEGDVATVSGVVIAKCDPPSDSAITSPIGDRLEAYNGPLPMDETPVFSLELWLSANEVVLGADPPTRFTMPIMMVSRRHLWNGTVAPPEEQEFRHPDAVQLGVALESFPADPIHSDDAGGVSLVFTLGALFSVGGLPARYTVRTNLHATPATGSTVVYATPGFGALLQTMLESPSVLFKVIFSLNTPVPGQATVYLTRADDDPGEHGLDFAVLAPEEYAQYESYPVRLHFHPESMISFGCPFNEALDGADTGVQVKPLVIHRVKFLNQRVNDAVEAHAIFYA